MVLIYILAATVATLVAGSAHLSRMKEKQVQE
jgi:hypothetical protein